MNSGALDGSAERQWRVAETLVPAGRLQGMDAAAEAGPGAQSPPHKHPNGEEVFVIDGAIEDEFGAYPAGTRIGTRPDLRTRKIAKGAILHVRLE